MIIFHLIPYRNPVAYIRGRNLIINDEPRSISIYDLHHPRIPKDYSLDLEISSYSYKDVDVHQDVARAKVIII